MPRKITGYSIGWNTDPWATRPLRDKAVIVTIQGVSAEDAVEKFRALGFHVENPRWVSATVTVPLYDAAKLKKFEEWYLDGRDLAVAKEGWQNG